MYLRTVRAKGAEGVELEYIRLVEAYWENGRSKQRIVANLGRKDLLAPHLESLIELLGGGKKTKASSAQRIEATLAACWGPMLVARWLWRELGLENILDGLAPKTNRVQKAGRLPLADRVLVLVANRLCRPGSEHALAQWLESDFVCGRDGKRILARWKQQGRVRVDLNWLQEWFARWTSCWRAKNKLHRDSAFRSLRLTTDKQPSPSSQSHNEIPASVPINVESITGQLHRSTMNSRASRWIISLAKSLRAVLFVDEPFPSTRTQTMRSAQLTNISDPGFIALSHVVRCCSPKASNTFASSPRSPMIFRTGAGDSLINVGVARI